MRYIRKIKPFFVDDRGELSHLLDGKEKFTSAILITCKKGSIRANHYHKKDVHYSYMLKGKMAYSYRNLKIKNSKIRTVIVKKGEIIYTPPMIEHAMRFLEDSEFIALTTEARSKRQYEKDTVRTKLIK